MSSCATDPEPINFGADQCDHCRMLIMDNKFGAEIISAKGKVFKFDAAECMVNYIKGGKISTGDAGSYYVIDASRPAILTDAATAFYLISENFPSPMGANLSAYAGRGDAESFQKKYQGEIMDWNQLLDKFKTK